METDDAGWGEVARQLAALELPPVPPTADPQRLLGYVLGVLPRFSEMEMMSTHLRLYAASVEQDLEQARGHAGALARELAGEREKRQFLERYAAQVVKERNELLHAKAGKRKGAASHFVWHACCKKNQHHTLDVTPSMAAFRGEKLQERVKEAQALQEEARNLEALRRELDFMLKKTQREHDSKMTASSKQIQHLEKQVLQRAMLNLSLERKIYDVESALARYDSAKADELGAFETQLKDARDRLEKLQTDNKQLNTQIARLTADHDRATRDLADTTHTKDEYASRIDSLSVKCAALESTVEALQSEIRILQTNDLDDVRGQYLARIKKLQDDAVVQERNMSVEIDRLRHEMERKNEELAVLRAIPPNQVEVLVENKGNALNDISLPAPSAWSHDKSNSIYSKSKAMGSSLSRSQLSSSVVSSPVTQIDAYKKDVTHSPHRELDDAVGEVEYDDAYERRSFSDGSPSKSTTPFNWESFIKSESEMSLPEAKRTRRMSSGSSENSADGPSSAIEHHSSRMSEHLSGAHASPYGSEDDSDDMDGYRSFTDRSVHEPKDKVSRELDYAFEEEEEKEEHGDTDGSNDLVQDLHCLLNGFEQRRKQEEEKAALAEQALLEFEQMESDMHGLRISPKS